MYSLLNMRNILALTIIVIVLFVILYFNAGIRPTVDVDSSDLSSILEFPQGFTVSVFADDLGRTLASYPGPNTGPRFMAFKDDTLIVSLTKQGAVVALPDENKDGVADRAITIIENLNKPHGLIVKDGGIIIAQEGSVDFFPLDGFAVDPLADKEHLADLPTGSGHSTRSIIQRDDSLFISVGSSCNVCEEQDNRRAAILECVDNNCDVYASGLRNSVGLAIHPITNELFASENGRDRIGNDIPPEEINIIEEGKNYGWPICYSDKIHDTDYDKNTYIRNPCEDTTSPAFEMQAHSAPLGMSFYTGNTFPEEYHNDLFVAYHGSWNRNPPTGYKVVRIIMQNNKPVGVEDFISGWLKDSSVVGRPVDVVVGPDGSMYISDDAAGKIYRVTYEGN